MKLSFLILREAVLTGLENKHKNKRELLSGILDLLFEKTSLKDEGISKEDILQNLIRREEELSTAVGEGFAFPHARISGLKGFYMLLGISKQGLEFASPDRKPVNFFILSLVSSDNPNLLLKSRAALMRFLLSDEIKERVLELDSADAIWKLLDSSDIRINEDILARDIMWPQIGSVSPEMSLKEVAFALHRAHIDSLPVLGEGGRFLGDISCYDLFSYGLPNFFSSLKTISFIRHMDPFEKYFQVDQNLKVEDIKFDREYPVISPDTTLMEIIFEMTTNNKHLLYVIENGKLLGVIDRFSIVDKVLLTI
ncbi:MAG: hypothetical protein A2017_02830 [Lentisphaerae bacterium GWF2_44_16]|nr:MAG: hypothetical protein A2017_02830 [Lentisphaerae bacterium GWF2_44_16]